MSGIKHDQNKAPMDLLPHEALVAVANVLAFGEKKYSAGNWAKGIEYRRLISAAQRHLGAFNSGEDKDEESGLSHVAHAACCLLFLSYMEQKRPDLDNRWTREESTASRKKLELHLGKRYRRRDGRLSGRITANLASPFMGQYPFYDPQFGLSFTLSGQHLEDEVSSNDLIEEVE